MGILSLAEVGRDKAVLAILNLESREKKIPLTNFRGAESLIPPDALEVLSGEGMGSLPFRLFCFLPLLSVLPFCDCAVWNIGDV